MIVGGDVHAFALPLREPLVTAASRIDLREGALLVLRDADGRRGFGEASPFPDLRAFARESLATARETLAKALPRLEGRPPEQALSLLDELAPARPASRFALETALVDLAAQKSGVRMADWLAGGRAPRDEVSVNALVVNPQAPEDGYETFKLKVGARELAEDVRRVAALREAVGPDAAIRLDANGAWSFDEARAALADLARFGLEYVEDPIAVRTTADVEAMAALRAEADPPLAVDEAAGDPLLLEALLAKGATDVLVLKPSCLGGLLATRQIACDARGPSVVITSTIDSAIGLTAALQLAVSLPGESPACGLATSKLLATDLAVPPAVECGRIRIPTATGLGLEPHTVVLR